MAIRYIVSLANDKCKEPGRCDECAKKNNDQRPTTLYWAQDLGYFCRAHLELLKLDGLIRITE